MGRGVFEVHLLRGRKY